MTNLFASKLTDVSCTLGSEDIDKIFNSTCRMLTWIVPYFQNSHFGTICESWLFEITPFHTQNIFISKAKQLSNTKVLKLTLHLHETSCYWLKCQKLPHHPMQILVNFEIEGKWFDKVSRIQAVLCYRWLIGWTIRECKWNWYSPYSFSENW